jgi:RNA polymerase sigma-70 factor (ECF subfamily)
MEMRLDQAELLRNMGWIRALARTLAQEASRADDVAQDALVLALERPPRALEGAGLRAWLAKVVASLAHTRRRSERRRAQREAAAARDEALPATLDVVERGAMQRAVIAAVMALEEPERATLLLHYLEGISTRAIAEQRGESHEAVRKRLARARAKLRERLEREHGGRDGLLAALAPLFRSGAENTLPLLATLAGGLVLLAGSAWWLTRAADGRPAPTVAATGPSEPAQTASAQPPAAPAAPERVSLALAEGRLTIEGVLRTLPYPGLEFDPTKPVEVALTLGKKGFFQDRLQLKTTTDPAGGFRFELDDPGPRPLEASLSVAEDALHRAAHARAVLGEGERVLRSLVLERVAHGAIAGIVRDASGAPVPAARVVFAGTSTFIDAESDKRVEETSDADGRFSLQPFAGAGAVTATAPGLRQIDATRLEKRKEGGWEPLTLVLGPVGSLNVLVEDAEGRPLEGVGIEIDVSADEPDARREASLGGDAREKLLVDSDAQGRVHFEEVWAGVELCCRVYVWNEVDSDEWSSERQRDGLLVPPGDHGAAQALVVVSGLPSELRVRVPPPCVVEGRVLLPDRTPASHARLRLSPGDDRATEDIEADADGRFRWSHHLLPAPEGLSLSALHPGDAPGRGAIPLVSYSTEFLAEAYTTATSRWIPASELGSPLELVLEPVLAIQGAARHRDGGPARGALRYRRQGSAGPARLDSGRSSLGEDGTFLLAGLVPGRYDLELQLAEDFFFTWSKKPRAFPGVEAGTSGLALIVEESASARITLDATLDGVPVSHDRVIGFFDPLTPRAPTGCVPPREATYRRLDGWPGPATLTVGGGQASARDAMGSHRFMYLGSQGRVQPPSPETFEVAPGWYWIGLRGWEESFSRPLHPTGAGLVYLEPGDYRFHFELTRVGELRGRVLAAEIEPDLCVALVTADGGAVQTRRRSHTMDTLSPTGADGSFWLQGAPVGAFTLRVGREEELRAGRFAHAQPVTVTLAGHEPLTIRLR